MQRIRVHFSKKGAMRFTGHLDLARTWARFLRRANIPVAHSQGYNPQPRINLAAALPLGFTSESELIDIWLKQTMEEIDILDKLRGAEPPGLSIHEVWTVDLNEKSLPARLRAVEYAVELENVVDLENRVNHLLGSEKHIRKRRDKEYDLRPLIIGIEISDSNHLSMRLVSRPGKTGRPDEVVAALGLDPLSAQVHRTQLIFSDSVQQKAEHSLE